VLPLYGFRVVLLPTLAVSGVVFFALSLERLLRLIQVVTENGASPGAAWGLIVFLFPHYLELALPAGFFFGVMLGVRRLHDRSELVVMRSLGIPARRLYFPIGVLAALLTLAMLALTVWGQPYARYVFRQRMNAIVSSDPLQQLAPGSFLSIGTDTVLRANAVLVRGRAFGGFFLSRQVEPGVRDYVTATNAQVMTDVPPGEERALYLRLSNGVSVREKDKGSSPTQMSFGSIVVSIPLDRVIEEPGPRGYDEQELTGTELLSGQVDGRKPNSSPAEIRAELHRRAVNVLALPVLGFLALPLALMGQGRSARASGLGVGLVVLLIFEKTARLGKVMAETDRLSPWIGVWVPWLCLLLLSVLAYRRFSGDLTRPRRRTKQMPPSALPREAVAEGG
jgi:lipopolysaccharide export system permease protein